MKMVMDDELQALPLLNSLPDSWETLVVSLSNFAQDRVLTMSQILANCLIKRQEESQFQMKTQRVLLCKEGVEAIVPQGHGKSLGRSREQKYECYHCAREGHDKGIVCCGRKRIQREQIRRKKRKVMRLSMKKTWLFSQLKKRHVCMLANMMFGGWSIWLLPTMLLH